MGTNYVREQTVGGIVLDAYHLYKNNFIPLCLIYFLPLFPIMTLQQYHTRSGLESVGAAAAASLVQVLVTLLIFPCMTVAVSEICLGNKVSVLHCYRRAIEKNFKGFIVTYLLLVLVVTVGMLLLIIPGIIFCLWYLFALQVVVLESLHGNEALKRSKELGKGFYLRNAGVYFVLTMIMWGVYILLAALIGVIMIFFAGADFQTTPPGHLIYGLIDSALLALLTPFPLIGLVLLYYDMRARKEAYDSTTLAEDLLR